MSFLRTSLENYLILVCFFLVHGSVLSLASNASSTYSSVSCCVCVCLSFCVCVCVCLYLSFHVPLTFSSLLIFPSFSFFLSSSSPSYSLSSHFSPFLSLFFIFFSFFSFLPLYFSTPLASPLPLSSYLTSLLFSYSLASLLTSPG